MQNLDETHGLTSEQLASWLLRHGWEKQPQYAFQLGGPSVLTGYQFCKQGSVIATGSPLHDAIAQLAELEKRNLQSILREINPRMRKGMPSEAARKACAFWLVRDAETGEVELHRTEGTSLYSASDYKSGTLNTEAVPLRDFGDWMEFWPCDDHGNKVLWPTDANGEML